MTKKQSTPKDKHSKEDKIVNDMPETQEEATNAEAEANTNLADLQAQLDQAQQSTQENWGKFLRSQAEIENLKRRQSKELENAHKFALEGFVKALLEVKDSLSMGLKSAQAEQANLETLIEGIQMTDKVFLSTLEKFNVQMIDPKEQSFNPELHQAVTMVPNPDTKANIVLEVVQVGWTLNNRLIRPAMVVVSS
jgi:molecular chaperone GrpE